LYDWATPVLSTAHRRDWLTAASDALHTPAEGGQSKTKLVAELILMLHCFGRQHNTRNSAAIRLAFAVCGAAAAVQAHLL
jgi:hypothetical protein